MDQTQQVSDELSYIFDIMQKSGTDITPSSEIDLLDSIALMELSMAIEISFDIEISGYEIMSCHDVDALTSLIAQKVSLR